MSVGGFPIGGGPIPGPFGPPGPIPGGAPGLALRIGGNPDALQYLFYRSWRVTEQLNGRNRLSCRLVVKDGFLPALEQDVVLTKGSDIWFAGFIWDYAVEFLSEGRNDWTTLTVNCVDWNAVCDRRLITAIYRNRTLGAIVRDIVAKTIGQEGIADTGVQDGPLMSDVVFSSVTVAQAFTELSRLTGFFWRVDYRKVLHFFQRETSLSTLSIVNGGTAKFRRFRKHASLAQYRNSQLLDGGKGITLPRQESFRADGQARSWQLEFPAAELLAIHVNGIAVPVGDIGTRGEQGKVWYWAKGDKSIGYDAGQPVLTEGTILTVTYRGLYDLATKVIDYAGVEARKAAAGGSGTGLWEHSQVENSLDGEEVNLLRAKGLLDQYGLSVDAEFELLQDGLAVGQQVPLSLPELGITNQLHLVTELETRSLVLSERIYLAKTTDGALKGTFREFWEKLNRQQPGALNPDQVVQNVLPFPETMELEDAVSVTRSAWLPAEWSTGIWGESEF